MTTQAKPVIELRNIKTSAFASEETHCYEATLIVDGEKWGVVSNDGHGGADHFHGAGRTYDDLAALEARIAATYPEHDLTDIGCPGKTMAESLESLCCEIVNEHLTGKTLKSLLTRKVVFTKPDQAGIYEVPLKSKGKTRPVAVVIDAVTKRTPGVVVLNSLPFADALTIFRKAA